MFIEFQFGNFRSFREIEKFSMQASYLRSNDLGLEENNVLTINGNRLLKSKAIYGANNSGKSNICQAMAAFVVSVINSVSSETIFKSIWNERFKLITDWDDHEVFFQYTFSLNKTVYRYGYTILNEEISKEWLFENTSEKTIEFFIRNKMDIKLDKKFPASGIFMEEALKRNHELFRKDSLFITAAALNGNKFAASIRNKIKNILIIDGAEENIIAQNAALKRLETGSPTQIRNFKNIFIASDTGIEDIEIRNQTNLETDKITKDNSSNNLEKLFSIHSKYDDKGMFKEKVSVPFEAWESKGTKKLFGLIGLVLDALDYGKTLIIDEFDARFHPNLTLKIVSLFNDVKTNPKNGQLIFITHDAGLLCRAQLRRDQICFVSKDKFGLSTLKTLIEFKGVRKDASYEKEYLNGTYGAIPYLDEMDWALINKMDENGL